MQVMGLYGVIAAVISALFINSGICLQSLVQKRLRSEAELDKYDTTPLPIWSNSRYIAGGCYILLGFLLKLISDVLLPLSTAAPLSAQSIVYSTVLEFIFLGGKLSKPTAIAMVVIMVGMAMSLSSASYIDGIYSLSNLNSMFLRMPCIITSAVMFGVWFTLRELSKSRDGMFSGRIGLFYLAFSAGLFSGAFNLVVKSLLEVIKYGFIYNMHTQNATHSTIWILVLMIPSFWIIKVRFVGYALSEFHHVIFLPCYQILTILLTVLFGAIYYNDFSVDRIDYFYNYNLQQDVQNQIIVPNRDLNDDNHVSFSDPNNNDNNDMKPLIMSSSSGNDIRSMLIKEDSFSSHNLLIYGFGLLLITLGIYMLTFRIDSDNGLPSSNEGIDNAYSIQRRRNQANSKVFLDSEQVDGTLGNYDKYYDNYVNELLLGNNNTSNNAMNAYEMLNAEEKTSLLGHNQHSNHRTLPWKPQTSQMSSQNRTTNNNNNNNNNSESEYFNAKYGAQSSHLSHGKLSLMKPDDSMIQRNPSTTPAQGAAGSSSYETSPRRATIISLYKNKISSPIVVPGSSVNISSSIQANMHSAQNNGNNSNRFKS